MIGILSDAHGNAEVFRRVVKTLFDMGAQRLVFLGDAVGYIPDIGVLEQLMALGDQVQCVLGNHEEMLLEGNYPARLEAVYQIAETRCQLSADQLAYVRTWPRMREMSTECGRLLFVHGSPHDYQNGYVYPDTELKVFDVPYDYIFMGHTHRAFVRTDFGKTFVNVGSCGLPRDDGRYASAVLFDPASGAIRLIRIELSFFSSKDSFSTRNVHASVYGLFDRRQSHISGEVIESNQ